MVIVHVLGAMLLSFLALHLGRRVGLERQVTRALAVLGVGLLLGVLIFGDDGPFRTAWLFGLSFGMFLDQGLSRRGGQG